MRSERETDWLREQVIGYIVSETRKLHMLEELDDIQNYIDQLKMETDELREELEDARGEM